MSGKENTPQNSGITVSINNPRMIYADLLLYASQLKAGDLINGSLSARMSTQTLHSKLFRSERSLIKLHASEDGPTFEIGSTLFWDEALDPTNTFYSRERTAHIAQLLQQAGINAIHRPDTETYDTEEGERIFDRSESSEIMIEVDPITNVRITLGYKDRWKEAGEHKRSMESADIIDRFTPPDDMGEEGREEGKKVFLNMSFEKYFNALSGNSRNENITVHFYDRRLAGDFHDEEGFVQALRKYAEIYQEILNALHTEAGQRTQPTQIVFDRPKGVTSYIMDPF